MESPDGVSLAIWDKEEGMERTKSGGDIRYLEESRKGLCCEGVK